MTETPFKLDQQIDTNFLSYLRSELSEEIAYEITPKPLSGGKDSLIYQYKLAGKEPRILRILRPTREASELLYLKTIYQTLSHHGLNVPLIHHVCEDKSVLGGSFAVMDLLPGKPLSAQKPETQTKILGESMAKMHALDVKPIIDELRQSGIRDEHFLSPTLLKNFLNILAKNYPWTLKHVDWLRERLPLAGGDLSIIHGDYHAGNLMFKQGSITGVLDWGFCIADPAIDLAHTTNVCLLFARHFSKDISPKFCEHYLEQILKTYRETRPVSDEQIKAFRVAELLRLLCFAESFPEQLQSPEAQQEYAAFIEEVTGLPLPFEHSTNNSTTAHQ